jgi:hypothetical protein
VSLKDKALLVTLARGLPPVSKTDKRITALIQQQHGTNKLRASKKLLPDTALDAVRAVHGEAYKWHRAHTVAWGDDSSRLLASSHFIEYSDKMRGFRQAQDALADDFTAHWPSYVDEARTQLKGAFNASDYPSQHNIRREFVFTTDFAPVPDGNDFRIKLRKEEMDELRAATDSLVERAEANCRADVARRLAEPLAAIVNRLTEKDAIFRDSLIGNLRDICDLMPALNITGDATLEAARQRIRAELYHTDADLCRENSTVRDQTARKAQSILDTMTGYFAPAQAAA